MKNFEKKINELFLEKKFRELKYLLNEMNEFDVAEILEKFDDEKLFYLFRLLNKEEATNVFSSLSIEKQKLLVNQFNDKELSNIINDLYIDDAVDLIEELPSNVVFRVLQNSSKQTRDLINQYLQYPENSIGSIMTAEYIKLRKSYSVEKSLKFVKKQAVNSATLETFYVCDETNHLIGYLTIKDLLTQKDETIIEDIFDDHVISANTHDDQEKAIELFNKYELSTLPVVDNENRLVGIVTFDDMLYVIKEEVTEDFEKMAAISPSESPYLKTGALKLASNRIVWLAVLMISDTIAGTILRSYEDAFRTLPILVSFIPMLIDTGGNAGSQSSTMIIRGLAIGEISIKDGFKVLLKEFKVGFIAGFLLALINLIRLYIMYPSKSMVILTVALSVFLITIISKMIGAILPIAAKSLKLDPAIMAAPLITTIIDAVGLILYFKIAVYFLNI